MKKALTLLAGVFFTTVTFAQEIAPDTTHKKEYKNVIGTDVTAFLMQFLNSGSTVNYYYNYRNMFSYRRLIGNGAIRVSFGGTYSNGNGTQNDTLSTSTSRYWTDFGAGYEHYSPFGKRWTFYYGADAVGNYTYYNGTYPYTTSSYREQESQTFKIGLSPLFGLSFRINSRLSVATETSYDILYERTKGRDIDMPALVYARWSESDGFSTQFNGLTNVSLRIRF